MTPEENANRRNIRATNRQIEEEYDRAIQEAFKAAASIRLVDGNLNMNSNPVFVRKLNEIMKRFRVNIEAAIVNGIENSWAISERNFSGFIYKSYDGRTISDELRTVINATYERQLQAFLDRTVNGLKLSDRIWNLSNQFQAEIQYTLFSGLSEGRSASSMAKDMKQYLREPDRLFRRVRNTQGKLVLSNAAKEYKPGQGIYRSSYKNAFRVSRTEVNTAYRSADHIRFKNTPFVLGVEIRLSDAHPEYDMCDELVGIYPTWFKFTGWHIQCICYAVPVLPSPAEFEAYQQALIRGESYEFMGKVTDIPPNAFEWVKNNKERISRWKSAPSFIQDNPGRFKLD